jgi:hypothetical protein
MLGSPVGFLLGRFGGFQSFTQRADGEKLVAARLAAECRNVHQAAGKGEGSGNVFRGDFLEVQIAANAAMGVKEVAEGQRTGVEPALTLFAPPRHDASKTKDVIRGSFAPRAPRLNRMTNGARYLHFKRGDGYWRENRIKEAARQEEVLGAVGKVYRDG